MSHQRCAPLARRKTPRSNWPAAAGRMNEASEQGMTIKGAGLELGVELHPHKPGMVAQLNDLDQSAIRRQTAENQAFGQEHLTIGVIELIPVAMTFGDLLLPIQLRPPGCRPGACTDMSQGASYRLFSPPLLLIHQGNDGMQAYRDRFRFEFA